VVDAPRQPFAAERHRGHPLRGDALFALAQRAPDFFWAGIGLGSAGLFARSLAAGPDGAA